MVTNYSIRLYSIIFTQIDGSKYCYVIPIIQLRLPVKEYQVLLFNTNNSIQHYSYSQVVPSITMYHKQFNFNSLICLNTVKWSNCSISKNSIYHKIFVCTQIKFQFYLTHRQDLIRWYHCGSEWAWNPETGFWPSDSLESYPKLSLGDV